MWLVTSYIKDQVLVLLRKDKDMSNKAQMIYTRSSGETKRMLSRHSSLSSKENYTGMLFVQEIKENYFILLLKFICCFIIIFSILTKVIICNIMSIFMAWQLDIHDLLCKAISRYVVWYEKYGIGWQDFNTI